MRVKTAIKMEIKLQETYGKLLNKNEDNNTEIEIYLRGGITLQTTKHLIWNRNELWKARNVGL